MAQETRALGGDRRITLEHLRAFVAVAESGGFLHAGYAINRTQSAITQSVKRLEDYLRCRLLERGQGQATTLTPDGLRLLPEARSILANLDAAVRVIQRPELRGRITVGMQPGIETGAMQTAIAACMAVNPGLRIQVTSDISFRLIALMDQGLLDVALICRIRDEELPEGVTQRILKTEPLCWVGSRAEEYGGAREVPLVVSADGCTSRAAAVEALEKAGMSYYLSLVSGSMEGVANAVAAGFGVTVLGQSETGEKQVMLGKANGLPPLPDVRIALRTVSQSPVIRQFCDLIAELPAFAP